MMWNKLKRLNWSRRAWRLIAGIPFAISSGFIFDFIASSIAPESEYQHVSVVVGILVSALYCLGVFIYAIVVNRWIQRTWKWLFAQRINAFDVRWLRWAATFTAGVCGFSIAFFGQFPWLLLPSIAALGIVLCLYFGHLLFFRLQCSLLELLATTTFFGLVDGLILSTPGALKLGLYFSPMVAAWVLYGTAAGLVQTRLLGPLSERKALLHIAAAWLGNASLALLCVGVAILFAASNPRLGMQSYTVWSTPLVIVGTLGFIVDLWSAVKIRQRAKSLLAPAVPALNSPAIDATSIDISALPFPVVPGS
jgi:hypothetical protein